MSKYQEMSPEQKEAYKTYYKNYYKNLPQEKKDEIVKRKRERRAKQGKYPKEIESGRIWNKKNGERLQEEYRKLKKQCVELKGGKCLTCFQSFPDCVFDFHHREAEQKDSAVGKLIGKAKGKMTQKLLAELHKCDLLCSNCHRIIHHVKQQTPEI